MPGRVRRPEHTAKLSLPRLNLEEWRQNRGAGIRERRISAVPIWPNSNPEGFPDKLAAALMVFCRRPRDLRAVFQREFDCEPCG